MTPFQRNTPMGANISRALPWLPTDPPTTPGAPLLRAGVWWDAVSVPAAIADRVMAALAEAGDEESAILADPAPGVVYWLVPVGTARGWRVPYTHALGVTQDGLTQYLNVPHATASGPGLHWKRAPEPGARWLADPVWLATAVAEVACRVYGAGR